MNKPRKIAALITASGLLLSACASSGSDSSDGSSDTVTVAILVDRSGPTAPSQAGTEPAAKAWESYVNSQGGIDGKDVRVLLLDSGSDAAKGLTAVQDAVQNEGALAIVNSDNGVSDAALAPFVKQNDVAVMTANPSSPTWLETPGWFALGIPYADFGGNVSLTAAALQAIKDAGRESLAAVVCGQIPACLAAGSQVEEIAPDFGLRFDGVLKYDPADTSYTAQCLALKDKQTELVYAVADSDRSGRLKTDCVAQGYDPTFFLPGFGLGPNIQKVDDIDALGAVPAIPWFADTPETATFREALTDEGVLDQIDETSVLAWVGLEAFRAAASSVSGEMTPEAVMSGMYGLQDFDADGMSTPVSFEDGEPSPVVSCYWVTGYQNNEFVQPQGEDPKCLS